MLEEASARQRAGGGPGQTKSVRAAVRQALVSLPGCTRGTGAPAAFQTDTWRSLCHPMHREETVREHQPRSTSSIFQRTGPKIVPFVKAP